MLAVYAQNFKTTEMKAQSQISMAQGYPRAHFISFFPPSSNRVLASSVTLGHLRSWLLGRAHQTCNNPSPSACPRQNAEPWTCDVCMRRANHTARGCSALLACGAVCMPAGDTHCSIHHQQTSGRQLCLVLRAGFVLCRIARLPPGVHTDIIHSVSHTHARITNSSYSGAMARQTKICRV